MNMAIVKGSPKTSSTLCLLDLFSFAASCVAAVYESFKMGAEKALWKINGIKHNSWYRGDTPSSLDLGIKSVPLWRWQTGTLT